MISWVMWWKAFVRGNRLPGYVQVVVQSTNRTSRILLNAMYEQRKITYQVYAYPSKHTCCMYEVWSSCNRPSILGSWVMNLYAKDLRMMDTSSTGKSIYVRYRDDTMCWTGRATY